MDPFTFVATMIISTAVSYGISYLFPAQGPRLKDLTISASTYGASIPQIYGNARTAGNLVWADKIIEHKKKKSAGKGGGGSYIDYTYTCTFTFVYCKGPVNSITKLWADGKVIVDAGATGSALLSDSSGGGGKGGGGGGSLGTTILRAATITLTTQYGTLRGYLGDEDQYPDAVMESIDGVGNVPGYRGLCYIVFQDFSLTNFGNRIPQMAAEVSVTGQPMAEFKPVLLKDTDPNAKGTLCYWGFEEPVGFDEGNIIIDSTRGFWYKIATHWRGATLQRSSYTVAKTNEGVGGFTRINLGTMTQDRNALNINIFYGPNPPLIDFVTPSLGWHVVGLSSTPVYEVYHDFISFVGGVSPNDGSIICQDFFVGHAAYQPYANITGMVKIDPTTLTRTTGTDSHWIPYVDDDGLTHLGNQAGPCIWTKDATFFARRSTSYRSFLFGTGNGNLSNAVTGGVDKGGYISVLVDANMGVYDRMSYVAYPDGKFGPIITSCGETDFALTYGYIDTTGRPANVGANNMRPDDGRIIQIYRWQVPSFGDTPWFQDEGDIAGSRDFFGGWVVHDRDGNGLIYSYSVLAGQGSADEPGQWIAKVDIDTATVVWRTFIGSGYGYTEPNSIVSGNVLGLLSQGNAVDLTGYGPYLYMIDTTTGKFINPTKQSDGAPRSTSQQTLAPSGSSLLLAILTADIAASQYNNPLPDDLNLTDQIVGYPVAFQLQPFNRDTPYGYNNLWDGNTRTLYWSDYTDEGFTSQVVIDKSYMGAITANGTGTTTLADIVENLLRQGGLTSKDFNLSALRSIEVHGYGFANNTDIKGVLQELRQVYLFDLYESDFKLKARRRGGTIADVTIDQRALGSSGDNTRDEWKQTRIQEADIPSEITLGYMDINNDFQASTANYKRPAAPIAAMFSRQQSSLTANIVMDATTAKNLVRTMIYSQWTERTKHDTRLPWTYAYLDPSDLLSINMMDGRNYFERIENAEFGADLSLALETFSQDSAQYIINERVVSDGGGGSNIVQSKNILAPSIPVILNTPLLRDSDDTGGTFSRYYAGVAYDVAQQVSTYPGGTLYESVDGGAAYTDILTTTFDIEWGRTFDATPYPPRGPAGVDWETTITITPAVSTFELSSITTAELWAGANPCIIGNEVMQFRDAVKNDDGTWTISYLLRGRRGTEWACSTHVANENCYFPDANTLIAESENLTAQGQPRTYKAVTGGVDISSTTAKTITYYPRDLMPYSPSDIRRDMGSDIEITWARRERFAGNFYDYTGDIPNHEGTEQYEIYILSGPYVDDASIGKAPSNSLRMATVSTPTYTYTAAHQAADGFNPATSTLHVAIFQISSIVGRGFPGTRDIAAHAPL
jgi:hypothetical protein